MLLFLFPLDSVLRGYSSDPLECPYALSILCYVVLHEFHLFIMCVIDYFAGRCNFRTLPNEVCVCVCLWGRREGREGFWVLRMEIWNSLSSIYSPLKTTLHFIHTFLLVRNAYNSLTNYTRYHEPLQHTRIRSPADINRHASSYELHIGWV